jgi:hypothetical protein
MYSQPGVREPRGIEKSHGVHDVTKLRSCGLVNKIYIQNTLMGYKGFNFNVNTKRLGTTVIQLRSKQIRTQLSYISNII